jgi:5-methylcytosine-specific restriction endonuclease McrA
MGDARRVGDPRWDALRAAAIERADGKCERCHTPSRYLCLKVVGLPGAGELELEHVQALCAGCLHGRPPKKFRGKRTLVVPHRRGRTGK